jgi:hypothetical protein
MNILHLSRVVFAAAAFAAAIPVHAAVAIAALPMTNQIADRKALSERSIDVDTGRIYFRGERRARPPEQLLTEVSYCSPEMGASYFPDEEEHLAAYLNKQYYRFK